ncbi:MAG: hypothetical protein HC905_28765 [Bacteroidales bacterium]|nr:hypothetical protein [Bacteroidales bacterium]
MNNNKQYQYVALGKPFVSYKYNANYLDFEDLVFLANSKEDYLNCIELALRKANENDTIEKGIKIAKRHSAEKRSFEFLQIVNSI